MAEQRHSNAGYTSANYSRPLVSVITLSNNSIKNLRVSLELLKKQDYPFIESIIIDRESTDGCTEYIKEFADEFVQSSAEGNRQCRWISEKDNGLYDAINKGIDLSTGEIIGCYWDMYTSDHVISDMVKVMMNEGTDGVHGDLLYVDKNGKTVRKWKMGKGSIKRGWLPGHPTLYLKRDVYDTYGKYNTEYLIAADYEFEIRCFEKNKVRLSYIPDVLIKMFYGGISNENLSAYWRSASESYKALRANGIRFAGLIVLKRVIRTLIQFRI